MTRLALDAVRTVTLDNPGSKTEIDIKRYAKVEKVSEQLTEILEDEPCR